ncbi:hypothetical protein Pcinc_033858 [Petrolisthes cinctipes]|uniref:Uncharacterized protein n=1 Tax=Petrolisthes cinctipes TaxID=88211 RepID=A0AAE1ERG6_PETCI|nr:hypothetical protein Pcinc_033858 [Petrolisthes cinctipes]
MQDSLTHQLVCHDQPLQCSAQFPFTNPMRHRQAFVTRPDPSHNITSGTHKVALHPFLPSSLTLTAVVVVLVLVLVLR